MKRRSATARLAPPHGQGFSLIELAVVVFIMSILLTLGITAMTAQMDSAAYSATQKKQDMIKDALITYLRTNKRLPCPEITGLPGGVVALTGREDRQGGSPPNPAAACSSYVGTVPWLDLGVAKDVVLDGYGNFFTYFVASAAAANEPDWTRTANPGVVTGFSSGNPGRFAITQNGIATTVDSLFNPLPALAAVVLVSHGKNGYGAVTEKGTRNADSVDASELANEPPAAAALPPAWSPQAAAPIDYAALGMLAPAVTATLVGSVAAGGVYDDVVLALRPNDLLTPIIKDGAMKSPQAQLSDSFANIKTALAAYALATPNGVSPNFYNNSACNSTGAAPPFCRLLPAASGGFLPVLTAFGLSSTDAIDPWGNPIRYTPAAALTTAGLNNGLSQATAIAAFQLSSDGPDRTQGTADDIAITVMASDLANLVGKNNLP